MEDKDKYIGYKGENSAVKKVAYLFEDGKLTSSALSLSYSYTEEIAKFLSERYQVVGKTDDDTFLFINNDLDKYSMGIGLSVESGFIMVMYIPQSPKSRSIQAADLQELKSILGI